MADTKCTRCKVRSATRGKKCEECADFLVIWQRDYRKKLRREKLCSSCNRPSEDGKVQCAECREKIRVKQTKRRAAGLCPCGKPRPVNRKKCDTCKGYELTCKARYREAGLCVHCGKERSESGQANCPRCLSAMNEARARWRAEAIAAYGGRCQCRGCREQTIEFLQLDHINNDGAEHRRQIGKGANIYLWARKNGFPPILQVLCANCHNAKSFYGRCPHELSMEARNGQDDQLDQGSRPEAG